MAPSHDGVAEFKRLNSMKKNVLSIPENLFLDSFSSKFVFLSFFLSLALSVISFLSSLLFLVLSRFFFYLNLSLRQLHFLSQFPPFPLSLSYSLPL